MSIFGSGDWLTKEERLLKDYCEDRPMFGGSDDVDEMREFIRQTADNQDISEMSIADIKRIKED